MHIRRNVLIDCKPKALWRCITEPELIQQWITDLVEEIPDDDTKTGLGAQSTVRIREGGRIVSYRCIVIEWSSEFRVGVRLSGGSLGPGDVIDVTYEIARGEDTGTMLHYDLNFPIRRLFLVLLAPFIWFGIQGNLKRDFALLAELAKSIKV